MLSGPSPVPWLVYCIAPRCVPYIFKTYLSPLCPLVAELGGDHPRSQPLSPLVPYFNWPGFVPLLCCNEKARGASRLKILSASPRSNSHTPKLGPLYKIYCLKLSRNKKFKRPGCFNALRWIIKKYAFPDNGEGNFNTFGCKFIEETLWHIFVWRLYMTLSCILISLCKEMVKYSSGVHSEFPFMLNIENEQDHFLKNRNLYKWDMYSFGSCTKRIRTEMLTPAWYIYILMLSVSTSQRAAERGSYYQYKAIDIPLHAQGHSIKTCWIKH